MRLVTPLSDKDVRSLRVGDGATLSGRAFTARDEAHMRALDMSRRGEPLPFELKDMAVYHCGPIVEKDGEGWKVVAAGPTTSSRMNDLEPEFIERFRPRAIIGKGGMSAGTIGACKRFGCVYLAFTGGAAVVAAKGIRGVAGVHWLDLGMPEAVWELELDDLGPLIVAIDTEGRSMYDDVGKRVDANVKRLKESL
ncbi:MAG: FumA C-terminus/TtdB family hydratase beta subunit [Euryarchaeota archaeon]|nr:FumA C-terminus/TtdB family hydratase beta subunit [Euryarchaeota archaeon]